MKHLKTLGLAVVAAAALMALVGAGTASATVLCNNNERTTICNEPYGAGTGITSSLASGTKAKLKTEFKTVECSKSTVSGKTENAGSSTETVKEPVETLTFEECNCEVKVLKKGTVEIHWISGGSNGTVTENGAEVTVNCSTIFGTVHCIYVTEKTDLGTLTGGSPASFDVNASIPRLTTNALCTTSATWEATYEVTSPSPLYAIQAPAGPTKLCAEEANNCPEGQTYPEKTEFMGTATTGELIMHFSGVNWIMECASYELTGLSAAKEGKPLSVTPSPGFNTCAITAPSRGTCLVNVSVFGGGSVVALGNKKDGRWKFGQSVLQISNCQQPELTNCEFQELSPAVTIKGGNSEAPATIEVNRNFPFLKSNKGDKCPASVTWKVTYVIGKEKGVGNLFVTE